MRNGERTAEALTARELCMLCRVYNELLNNEKQVARAKILWDREPGHPEATQWMANSLLNSLGRSKTESKDFIEFVDDALS